MRIFTILEKIKEEQRNQSTLLKTILSKLGEGSCESDPIPEDLHFPITSEAEMGMFEEYLKDKSIQKAVVSCIIE